MALEQTFLQDLLTWLSPFQVKQLLDYEHSNPVCVSLILHRSHQNQHQKNPTRDLYNNFKLRMPSARSSHMTIIATSKIIIDRKG